MEEKVFTFDSRKGAEDCHVANNKVKQKVVFYQTKTKDLV